MLKQLGAVGGLGVLLVLAGIAVVALESIIIAGGIALVLGGIGVVAFALIKNVLKSMGMGAML